jgi:hypothetical protein
MPYNWGAWWVVLLLGREVVLDETICLAPDHVFKQAQTSNSFDHYLKYMLH